MRAVRSDRWLIPAIALGTTLAPLNSTMIAVALPGIQDGLGASVTATALLVSLYLVAMAVGQPIAGRLGDIYGRRRLYLVGLVWFAAATVGCALASGLAMLIAFRVQQGIAGALVVPTGIAVLRAAVAAERRGAAFGTIGLAAGIAAASGPALGGLLVAGFGWQSIFWANLPVVFAAGLLAWRVLPADAPAEVRDRFDVAGSVLFAATLAAFLVIPTLLKLDLIPVALVAAAAVAALGAVFARWELRQHAPTVDLRLFRRRDFAAGSGSILLGNLVMYTTLLALPLYLARVRGHEAWVMGLTLAVLSGLSALTGPIGGRLSDLRGARLPAGIGAGAMLAGALVLVPAAGGDQLLPIVAALGLMGIGLGISGAPVQAAAMGAVAAREAGAAAGLFSTARYLGSVTGAGVLAIVFASNPTVGEADRFVWLFAGLAAAALFGLLVTLQIGSTATRNS